MRALCRIVVRPDLPLTIFEVSNGRLAIINRSKTLTKTLLIRTDSPLFMVERVSLVILSAEPTLHSPIQLRTAGLHKKGAHAHTHTRTPLPHTPDTDNQKRMMSFIPAPLESACNAESGKNSVTHKDIHLTSPHQHSFPRI